MRGVLLFMENQNLMHHSCGLFTHYTHVGSTNARLETSLTHSVSLRLFHTHSLPDRRAETQPSGVQLLKYAHEPHSPHR